MYKYGCQNVMHTAYGTGEDLKKVIYTTCNGSKEFLKYF